MSVNLEQSGGGSGGGTTLTGTGIARNTGACTELSGDVTTSGSNAASVVKVNGAAVPTTKTVVGTNGSGQIIDATGTALPASMFPALTGDVTTVAGALATTLKNTGTAGTYTKVTTDAQGRVSSGTTLAASDLPVTASGTGLYLPVIGLPTADGATTFGTANGQQGIKFISPVSIAVNNVTVWVGTGLAGALMGISFYDSTGATKLAHADGFSVATSTTATRTALNTTMNLQAGVAYWLQWTATTATTLTVENLLLTTNYCNIANKASVTVGNSNNTTASGVTGSTIGTMSSAQTRVPLMYFD